MVFSRRLQHNFESHFQQFLNFKTGRLSIHRELFNDVVLENERQQYYFRA